MAHHGWFHHNGGQRLRHTRRPHTKNHLIGPAPELAAVQPDSVGPPGMNGAGEGGWDDWYATFERRFAVPVGAGGREGLARGVGRWRLAEKPGLEFRGVAAAAAAAKDRRTQEELAEAAGSPAVGQ